MNNTFFASKVSIMNEFYRFAKHLGVDWDKALYGFVSDQRIVDSHLNVPGTDGKLGFGGTCFPKDINAFISFAKKTEKDPQPQPISSTSSFSLISQRFDKFLNLLICASNNF